MSFLKSHGLDLELLAARAGGRLFPRRKRKPADAELELELERRQEDERRGVLERASRKSREG